MPRQLTIEVRPVLAADIAAIAAAEPGRAHVHDARLVRTSWRDATYLSAWIDELPVGWVLVWWPDRYIPGMADECADRFGCVAVEDLYVIEAARRRGVGTALLDEAERRGRARGFTSIGLGVGVDNHIAGRMYEARGYRDAGLGPFIETGTNPGGSWWLETVVFLLKRL